MTETLSKREQNALRKAGRKELATAMKTAISGSGWKAKIAYNFAFRDNDGLFVEASYRQLDPDFQSGLRLCCLAKPMAMDPLMWQILNIEGNETKPPSFRAVGAFTAGGLNVETREIDSGDFKTAAVDFREFLDACRAFTPDTWSSFADEVHKSRSARPRHLFETHVLALLLEERRAEARDLAEAGLENGWSTKLSYYVEDAAIGSYPGRPFAEMALRWMDDTFKKQRIH